MIITALLVTAVALLVAAVLAIIFLPPVFSALYDLLRKPRDTLWRQHLAAFERRCGVQFSHAMLTLGHARRLLELLGRLL